MSIRNNLPLKFQRLGELSWLWMNSTLHTDWTIDLLARYTLPAISNDQYIILTRENLPIAYCSWANLSFEAECKYILNPSSLSEGDWNSGTRMWVVDWVAPFSFRDSLTLRRELESKFPTSLVRSLRVRKGKTNAKVQEHKGSSVSRQDAQRQFHQFHTELLAKLEQILPADSFIQKEL